MSLQRHRFHAIRGNDRIETEAFFEEVSLLFARLLFFVVRGFDICGPREDTVSVIPLCSRRWFQRVPGDSEIFLISDMTREKDFVDVAEF